MEALGAAAAITQFLELSFKAGKLACSIASSVQHAPKEIMQLDLKIQQLRSLVMQVHSLGDEVPETQPQVPLLSNHHMEMFSIGMKNIIDSLSGLKSAVRAPVRGSHSVRDRLRWATFDKDKAQSLLQDAQMVNNELGIMLQILDVRLSSLNQNSLAALSAGQSLMREEIAQSFDDFKAVFWTEMTQLKAVVQRPAIASVVMHQKNEVNVQPMLSRHGNDISSALMKHNMRVTQRIPLFTLGNGSRPVLPLSGSYTVGADLTWESRRKSRRAKLAFHAAFNVFGQHVLRLELSAQLLCRSWKFGPSLNSSLTVINLRPSHSPIFLACRQYNLDEVHYLLESGQASINDVDSETGGLLEVGHPPQVAHYCVFVDGLICFKHVVLGRLMDSEDRTSESEFLQGGQDLLEHLLDQGCDPTLIHSNTISQPAILAAFEQGFQKATLSMMSHGADLSAFGSEAAGLFMSNDSLVWKFRLLQSIGFSDWRLDRPSDNLLYGACWNSHLDLSLFALEIAGIDPNQGGGLERRPIGNAAQRGWIEGIAVLLQYGAYVNVGDGTWNGPPLRRSMSLSHIMTDTSHFLLLKGADPGLKDSCGLSAWGYLMSAQYDPEFSWYLEFSYLAFEGSVAHLLHHGSDPFETFISDYEILGGPHHITWFTQMGHLQASDIARFRSYGMSRMKDRFEGRDAFRDGLPEDLVTQLEMCDRSRSFSWTFQWNKDGQISWNQRCSSPSHVEATGSDSYIDDEESTSGSSTVSVDACSENEGSEYDGSGPYITKEGNFVAVWEHADSRAPDRTDPYLSYQLSPGFFTNATNFYRHTATLQGQRQLSRWPMVRALCDGLQHAGYRVEMDDDGDLWYDCDDGDRYFDAWETQPAEERDDWLVDVCPICQNFDEYGLGHVLDIEHEAIEKVQEYRRQVQEGKRRYF